MSKEIAKILIDIKSVNFSFDNHYTLTSGLKSPVYVDCRRIMSYVNEREVIFNRALSYFKSKNISFDMLAGGETAGIPYAAFLSDKLGMPMIYIRKKSKGFGINKQIEGNFEKNQKAIIIEDLATDGGSKITFVNALREAGLKVKDIFVIFYYDIFDFNSSELSKMNVNIHSLCTWKDIINYIQSEKILKDSEIENLKDFLSNPNSWREKNGWYSNC